MMTPAVHRYIALAFSLLPFASCIEPIEEYSNTPRGNFEALWTIMDEQYCFFEYKGVDWDKIHSEYVQKIKNDMNREALFALLNQMLQELKDGHVNLYTPFDMGRYWNWFEDYPDNFDADLLENNYLRPDYAIAGSFRYKISDDNVGYVYYGSFANTVGDANLDYIINKMKDCDGIIFDVRNNGGGTLTNVDKLVSRFLEKTTLTGYYQYKTGKKHNDFSELKAKYIEPSPRLRYQKTVIVLTNRKCFSAANEFVNAMRYCPNVRILGDRTGGGGGLPLSSELPNGWLVRFSACPNFDADKQHIEFGIDPDIRIDLLPSDVAKGEDTLIEAAKDLLKKQ
ncbi:MAG: S41 family peptidase [Dysgonamonadaceae bacterium]|jgi:C-terminal processing protease CtpA/Prc|nr:S41 family peptidase [Dysgonamonadaceae bacterium]